MPPDRPTANASASASGTGTSRPSKDSKPALATHTPYLDLILSTLPPWNNLKGSLTHLCTSSSSIANSDPGSKPRSNNLPFNPSSSQSSVPQSSPPGPSVPTNSNLNSNLNVDLTVDTRWLLDTVFRFALGGPCENIEGNSDEDMDTDVDKVIVDKWREGQAWLSELLAERHKTQAQTNINVNGTAGKRARSVEVGVGIGVGAPSPKKTKIEKDTGVVHDDPNAKPLYTLHSMSMTSPIRKKADITITSTSLRLTNPTSHAVESTIPLSTLKRAFLLSNKNKNNNKPRWSVVLLSEDTFYDGKGKGKEQGRPLSMQVLFTVEATSSSAKNLFTTTAHQQGGSLTAHPKGTDTVTFLRAFLSYLPDHITYLEPKWYVEAYRAAKEGFLFFMDEGLLWGDSKPCVFFAVEDIARDEEGGEVGVRTLSATGRAFSIFVRRVVRPYKVEGVESESESESESDSDEEVELEETEFAMIDVKEQDRVREWTRVHRHLFGRKQEVAVKATNGATVDVKGKGKEVAPPPDEEDESDEDFEVDSESDGGEPTDESDSDEEGEASQGGGDSEASDEDGEEEDEDEDVEELRPERHPLLRPGAMPKMSKATMAAVVGMMEEDMGVITVSDDDN